MERPNRRDVLRSAGVLTAGVTGTGVTAATNHAGVTVSESGGSTEVTEGGGTDSYTVVLDGRPSADVTIAVAADGQVTAETDALTFTPGNWDTPRTVTVAAADDATVEAPHQGTVTHTVTSGDQAYDGIDVADVTVSVTDNDLAAELEGPLTAVDEAAETVTVMGTTADVSNATFHTPTDQIGFAEVAGEPLPGRGSTPGFLGGTTAVEGTTPESGDVVVADTVTVTIAENVIVGAVTGNTIPEGGSLSDGTLAVQGTDVNPIRDDRYTPRVVADGTDLLVDPGTVPVGSAASAEGYLAQDGAFYVHTVEVSSGTLLNDATTISRVQIGRAHV